MFPKRIATRVLLSLAALVVQPVSGQDYPTQPIVSRISAFAL